MILFIVTHNYYSQTSVVGVFSTKEKAEEFIKDRKEKYPDFEYSIDEFGLDKSD